MRWPVGADPYRLITALLAVPRSAFETGGTSEFAAIKAAADKFNAHTLVLQEGPRLATRYRLTPNRDIDARDWCEGFMAAVTLNAADWREALDPNGTLDSLLRPIMSQCQKVVALPLPGLPLPGLPRREVKIPFLAPSSHTAIPMCVAGPRQQNDTICHDKPGRPIAPLRA